jgi:hypothetical protein
MLKNITLSVEDVLIQKARQKAMSEKKTLNMLFRDWLKKYVHKSDPVEDFDRLMEKMSYARTDGKKFTREEMNER